METQGLIIDNFNDDNDVVIKYYTPFGDIEAEHRHDDISKTFYSMFRQLIDQHRPIAGYEYIERFNDAEVDEGMLGGLQFSVDDGARDVVNHLPPNERNAFVLTLFAFYDFLNKTEQLMQTKIFKIDISRQPTEFWLNFRKCDIEIGLVIQQLLPLIMDIKTLSSMLIDFLNAYNELVTNPNWRMLYTFIMINMLNAINRLTFRPNMKSIGAFINVTDEIENLSKE